MNETKASNSIQRLKTLNTYRIQKTGTKKIPFNTCARCNVLMDNHNEYTMICPKCSCMTDVICNGNSDIYINAENITSSLTTGNRSYDRIIYAITGDPQYTRKRNFLTKITGCNSSNTEFTLPNAVLDDAVDIYIESGYAFKSASLKGALGACLYFTCHDYDIPKTYQEIANMLQVDCAFISAGITHILQKVTTNVIKRDLKINACPILSKIKGSLETLYIDTKYTDFLTTLVSTITRKQLPDLMQKEYDSVIMGAIYLLSICINKPLKKTKINGISHTTYIDVSKKIIANRKSLRNIFRRYDIPSPPEWLLLDRIRENQKKQLQSGNMEYTPPIDILHR